MNSGMDIYCLRDLDRPDALNGHPLGTFVVALLYLYRTFVVAFNARVLDAKKEAPWKAICLTSGSPRSWVRTFPTFGLPCQSTKLTCYLDRGAFLLDRCDLAVNPLLTADRGEKLHLACRIRNQMG